MKITFYTRALLLLVSVHSGSFQNQPVCGIAGRPVRGLYLPSKAEYEFNEEIRYSCPGGSLKGDATRRCLRNGQWSGSIPVCLRIVQETDFEVIVVANQYVKNLLLSETSLWTRQTRIGECTRAYECKYLRIGIRFKNVSFILDGFKLTFQMPAFPKFSAFSEHPGGRPRSICNISDTRRIDDGNMTTVRLDCNTLKPSTSILLIFQPDKVDELLSLCHISIFFHPKIFGCGIPDTPLNGYVEERKDIKVFDFHCKVGFDFKEPHRSTDCNPDGTWSESSPTCVLKNRENSSEGTNNTEEVPGQAVSFGFDLNYLYIGLGCLGFIIVLVTMVCLIFKRQKNRDSRISTSIETHSSSCRRETSHNLNSTKSHIRVPCPLPRHTQSREIIMRRLQAEIESSADPNREPGSFESPYLTILEDLPCEQNVPEVPEPIYDECISDKSCTPTI